MRMSQFTNCGRQAPIESREVYKFRITPSIRKDWKSAVQKIVIILLLAALAFSWTRVAIAHLRQPGPPEWGFEDRSEEFHGFKAYVSRDINFTVAEDWGMAYQKELDQGVVWIGPIRENDVVMWVERSDLRVGDLRVGDIILYQDPLENTLIAHRIVGIDNSDPQRLRFRTKGDALAEEDNYLVDDGLKGAVIGVLYTRGD
jgi:hypothetical protein